MVLRTGSWTDQNHSSSKGGDFLMSSAMFLVYVRYYCSISHNIWPCTVKCQQVVECSQCSSSGLLTMTCFYAGQRCLLPFLEKMAVSKLNGAGCGRQVTKVKILAPAVSCIFSSWCMTTLISVRIYPQKRSFSFLLAPSFNSSFCFLMPACSHLLYLLVSISSLRSLVFLPYDLFFLFT